MKLSEFLEITGANESDIIEYSQGEVIRVVKQYGDALRYVHNQTEAICTEAVQQDGIALKYVHEQTEAICTEAVKEDGSALQYVHDQTETICIEAVQQDGRAVEYVNKAIFDKDEEDDTSEWASTAKTRWEVMNISTEEIMVINGVKYKKIN